MSLIGERLRFARERKNLTQTQVKKHTQINNKTLSRYENGGSEPDLETLKTLAELYEVTTDWLLGKDNLNQTTPSKVDKEILDEIATLSSEDKQYIKETIRRIKK